MHLALARRGLPRCVRQLHDLVGPPDPVSNLRKVVYDRVSESKTAHPYSVNEFPPGTDLTDPDTARARLDLEFNIARGRLDSFHHHFWADNNARFHAEKAAVLAAVPEPRTPASVEDALAEFHASWAAAERPRQRAYNRAWHRANRHLLLLALRKRYEIINKAYGRFWRPAESPLDDVELSNLSIARKSASAPEADKKP